MTAGERRPRTRWPAFLATACLLLLGGWLRLDQFVAQVLIDDEWHAVHQLIGNTPRGILTSFGHADHSIPLTLFYWLEADLFGLSELAMRWPLMACGLATLLLFPAYVRQRLGAAEALVFGLLVALSPLLIIYSRTARPYALTLLLIFVAVHAFEAYRLDSGRRLRHGLLYAGAATLATWAHLLAAPFVVMPCLLEAGRLLLCRPADWRAAALRLLRLGVPTALAMLAVILPPLLANPGALSGKAGVDLPRAETWVGIWFAWFGTDSAAVLGGCLALCALGWRRMWATLPLARTILAGLLLTLLLILLARPAWVNHSLTLARYLLPVLPLLLLATALGAVRLAALAGRLGGRPAVWLRGPLLLAPVLLLAASSPLPAMLRYPNTNTLHSVFQFDFRPAHNVMARHLDTFPVSPFWERLRALPPGSLRVAAAPWFFESYDWLAPRWEAIGRQPVLPGHLSGVCVDWRHGELPAGGRFRFRNAVRLADLPAAGGVDVVVFQKRFALPSGAFTRYVDAGFEAACATALQARLGPPDYEDGTILAFYLTPQARAISHAQR